MRVCIRNITIVCMKANHKFKKRSRNCLFRAYTQFRHRIGRCRRREKNDHHSRQQHSNTYPYICAHMYMSKVSISTIIQAAYIFFY